MVGIVGEEYADEAVSATTVVIAVTAFDDAHAPSSDPITSRVHLS